MTRIERPMAANNRPIAPSSHALGRFVALAWRGPRWLRRLFGSVLILIIIAVGLAYFGIANIPLASQMFYRPVEPIRTVSAMEVTPGSDILDSQRVFTEGQLTTLLQQLKRLPGSATVFYDLQATVEPNQIQIFGRLFRSDGFYRFIANAEPGAENGRLVFNTKDFQVQKVGLPASVVQPLFDQLATVGNGALLNATISRVTSASGQIDITIEPKFIR